MNDFFLSYANPDKPKARELAELLTRHGAKVAFDERDIKGGDDWVRATQRLLERSRVCVVVLSPHTNKASVQPREVYLAQYLQDRDPGWYRIVPVYLSGRRKPPMRIEGLDTVSAYFESQGGLPAVAAKLMVTLRNSGDIADRTLRSVSHLDEISRVWLHEGKRWGGRFRLDGNEIVFRQRGHEFRRIRRDQFAANLSSSELEQVCQIEQKMEKLYKAWKKHDIQVESATAEERANEFAAKLGSVVTDLLRLLRNGGFKLDDHYEHIWSVMDSYERRQRARRSRRR